MRLQVPIQLAEEFYTLGKIRRNEVARNFRIIASTKTDPSLYAKELRSSGVSEELISWFVDNAQKHGADFDVYTDSVVFTDDSDFIGAKLWYSTSKKELDERYRRATYGLVCLAIVILCIVTAKAYPPSVLLSLIFLPLYYWNTSLAMGPSHWKNIMYLWVFPSIATRLFRDLSTHRKQLAEPVPSKDFAAVTKIREFLANESKGQGAQVTGPYVIAQVSKATHSAESSSADGEQKSSLALSVANTQTKAGTGGCVRCSKCNSLLSPVMIVCPKCGQERNGASQIAESAITPEPITNPEPVVNSEFGSTEGNYGSSLAKLFDLYRSGAITDAEFKELRSQYPD